MFGVTSVGVFANTSAPVPVSSVTAAIKLALEGVLKNVATPVPKPVMLPTAGVTVTFEALVVRPKVSTVICATCVALP